MIRKFLTSVAVAGLAAGAANALEIENSVGVANESVPLAAQLDFTMTAGTVTVGIAPETGALPDADLVFYVEVSGASFTAQVTGAALTGPMGPPDFTANVSTGGAKGGNNVSFSVDNADLCAQDMGGATMEATCFLALPLALDGSDVVISVGVETDSGIPIDLSGGAGIGGQSTSAPASLTVYEIEDAWDIDIDPDTTPPIADLAAMPNGPFTRFTTGLNGRLGDVEVNPNVITYPSGPRTVVSDLAGTPVAATDVDAGGGDGTTTLTLTGDLAPFEDGNIPAGDVTRDGTGFTSVTSATDTAVDVAYSIGDNDDIDVDADGVTPIQPSTYTLGVAVEPDSGSSLVAIQSTSGPLSPIVRNGTTIVFPWTQSATQGAATGTTSVFRFGNLDTDAVGEVFVEVKNSSEPGFVNPGVVSVAPSIDTNGELVTTSSAIEALVGNYGRGDLEFTLEEAPDNLTGRQFVVRGDVIQQVTGGTIDEDLSNP